MSDTQPELAPITFLASLGARADHRAEPRASIAIAGAGCALGVLGVLVVSGDAGFSGDSVNRVPGIVLSALVLAAGFVALQLRTGPLATAGTVAASLAVPPLVFFVTVDEGSFPPYSTDAILLVSTAAWLGSYVVGPGRGRPFFLGAGLIGLWTTLLQLSEDLFDAPFGFFGGFRQQSGFEDGVFAPEVPTFHAPDPTTLGVLSLGLGAVYLVVGRWLDRRGHGGVATPFVVAMIPTLVLGVLFLSDDFEQTGTGLALLALGAALAWQGAGALRRATAWIGSAVAVVGMATFLSDMSDDATVVGMLFIAGGVAMVVAGHAFAVVTGERDELLVAEAVLTGSGDDGPTPEPEPDDELFRPPVPPPPAAPVAPVAEAAPEDDAPPMPPAPPPDDDTTPPPPT